MSNHSPLNEHAQYKRGLGCPQNGTHKTFQYQKNGSFVSFPVYIIIYTSYSCCNSCLINIIRMFSADIPVFLVRVSFWSEMANSRKCVRLSLVIDFDSLEGKVFKRRLDHVRKVLTPAGQSDLDNYGLVSAIFDSVMYNSVQQ